MALWRGHERLRQAVGVISWIVVLSFFFTAVVIWIFRDLETAANFIQVVSIFGLLSLASGLVSNRRADPPPREDAELAEAKSPAATTPASSLSPSTTATKAKRPSARWLKWQSRIIRGAAVVALTGALVIAAFAITPDTEEPPEGDPGAMEQPLIRTSGPEPVPFEGGTIWRWPDLTEGDTVVVFSPGGGPNNHGLDALRGSIVEVGNCTVVTSNLEWTFTGDGHFLEDGTAHVSGSSINISLPDQVNEIVLTMRVSHEPGVECSMGMEWTNPYIERAEPLPE